ncbi:hypothetical protein BSKO_11439 [Bryopsis sp. KO-2023]|nr:hypothetical protein BSKO_11439 [Bryopsis sp. KO-2023]
MTSTKYILASVLLAIFVSQLVEADNAVLIIIDDLGLDHLKLYGLREASTFAKTPNIDKLAANGMTFENAYSYPVCTATRTSILTGRFGFRTGVGCLRNGPKSTEFTIAKAMGSAGIPNACVGKWHVNTVENGGTSSPNKMGFDYYAGVLENASDYFDWEKTVNGITSQSTNYLTSEFTDDAIEWVEKQGDKPFFLWLAHFAVHSPFHSPPSELHSLAREIDGARGVRNKNRAMFKAMLEALDTEIGRLLNSLPLDTNIIFIGDNGGPTRVGEGPYDVGKRKGSLYQGGINVPFIVSGPAVASKGSRSDALIHTVDLFSTILELVGVDVGEAVPAGVKVDSLSFDSVLKGGIGGREYNYGEVFDCPMKGGGRAGGRAGGRGGNRRSQTGATSRTTDDGDDGKEGRVARNDRFKLIDFSGSGGEELYDLKLDPFEASNLLNGTPLSSEASAALDDLRNFLGTFS